MMTASGLMEIVYKFGEMTGMHVQAQDWDESSQKCKEQEEANKITSSSDSKDANILLNWRLCSVWRSFVLYFLSDAIISAGLLVLSECVTQRETVLSRNEDAQYTALDIGFFFIPVVQQVLSAACLNLSRWTFYYCMFFSRGFKCEREMRCDVAELSFQDDFLTLFGLTDRWRVTKSCQMWVNTMLQQRVELLGCWQKRGSADSYFTLDNRGGFRKQLWASLQMRWGLIAAVEASHQTNWNCVRRFF